jgi:hypothetical protein
MAVPHLLSSLVTGDSHLFRIDNHNVVPGIDVGRVFRFMLTSQSVRYLSGESTQNLVSRINDVPIMAYVLGSYRDRLHCLVTPAKREQNEARMLQDGGSRHNRNRNALPLTSGRTTGQPNAIATIFAKFSKKKRGDNGHAQTTIRRMEDLYALGCPIIPPPTKIWAG